LPCSASNRSGYHAHSAVPIPVIACASKEDIEGVAANVGGFTVQNLGPGQSQVAMRGVSAGQKLAFNVPQELRFSGGMNRVRWVAGGFYGHTDRDYGQDLLFLAFADMPCDP
jgi:hypothetical protein